VGFAWRAEPVVGSGVDAPGARAAASAPLAAGAAAPSIARRAEIVADGGYSMRVLVPERMIPGLEYEIILDIWDPDGIPVATSEMIVILIQPGRFERAHAARASSQPGHFVFAERFDAAGQFILRVHPPGGEASLQLYFEVLPTGSELASRS
jgi:hypothetical protein